MIKRLVDLTYRQARRIVIGVVGGTIVLIGIALIVLPGPAFIVIPAGLAVLSIEFAWARRFLHKVREGISRSSRSRRLSARD
jgi:tellurite resistance protein TerC